MEARLELLFLFLAAHAVADFGLQSDWMAQNKRTSKIVRLMHCLIHGGCAYVVGGIFFGVVETILHFIIDSITIKGKRPSLLVDQSLHIFCKGLYALST